MSNSSSEQPYQSNFWPAENHDLLGVDYGDKSISNGNHAFESDEPTDPADEASQAAHNRIGLKHQAANWPQPVRIVTTGTVHPTAAEQDVDIHQEAWGDVINNKISLGAGPYSDNPLTYTGRITFERELEQDVKPQPPTHH